MFTSCKIILKQNPNPGNMNAERYLEVNLLRPHIPVFPKDDKDMTNLDLIEWAGKFGDRVKDFTWWGRWRVGANSITSMADEAYSIGTSAHPRYKYWMYSIRKMELNFIENWTAEHGLRFGDEGGSDTTTTLTLHKVMMVGKGLEPFGKMGSGTVRVNSNTHILETGYPVFWDRII
ncbi:hypothetical protein [Vineibacter terrae]|uniref:hypothetical protein n=1 Tax=Vineibacter terrae TaxID=2586908 RepID=UPI002E352B79|nr:hypothetical protein [Vineibacter terrae]HEX2886728.1 hypothetical protein [Vineibacter terrae]